MNETEEIDVKLIIEELQQQGNLYKRFDEVLPKALGIRNKIRIYNALDPKGYYTALFIISQKSRVLMKDVRKMEEIYHKLVLYCDHQFKHKLIKIDAPLCSKAAKAFQEAGWRIL
jgi:hypothetical protein